VCAGARIFAGKALLSLVSVLVWRSDELLDGLAPPGGRLCEARRPGWNRHGLSMTSHAELWAMIWLHLPTRRGGCEGLIWPYLTVITNGLVITEGAGG
jgi:hypothetical protein